MTSYNTAVVVILFENLLWELVKKEQVSRKNWSTMLPSMIKGLQHFMSVDLPFSDLIDLSK